MVNGAPSADEVGVEQDRQHKRFRQARHSALASREVPWAAVYSVSLHPYFAGLLAIFMGY